MLKITFTLFLIFFFSQNTYAGEFPAHTEKDQAKKIIYFGVIPQQSSKKITKRWMPLVNRLSSVTGLDIRLKQSLNIGVFESQMLSGQFDVAYVNPLLYLAANHSLGYQAIAKEKDKKLQGIIVVRKNGKIKSLNDLNKQSIVFPENAFAATTLTQSYLNKFNIKYNASFVSSHDTGYKLVSLGKYVAAGGVNRTFNAMNSTIKSRLKVLKEFKGVTPHPFAAHPRLSDKIMNEIQSALIGLSSDAEGKKILKRLRFNALSVAKDDDWADVRNMMILK